jgi:hypothetical protein
MNAIPHQAPPCADPLLGSLHKASLPIRTDRLDGLAPLARPARDKGGAWALLTVCSHPQQDGLLIKTAGDQRDHSSLPRFS